MRDCAQCREKHLGQILVLYDEFRAGHCDHYIYIVGHLAELESHLMDEHIEKAFAVRELRKLFQADKELDTKQLTETLNEYHD